MTGDTAASATDADIAERVASLVTDLVDQNIRLRADLERFGPGPPPVVREPTHDELVNLFEIKATEVVAAMEELFKLAAFAGQGPSESHNNALFWVLFEKIGELERLYKVWRGVQAS